MKEAREVNSCLVRLLLSEPELHHRFNYSYFSLWVKGEHQVNV